MKESISTREISNNEKETMRFYNESHKYTCGIDLHKNNLHMCVQDETGKALVHRRLPNSEQEFLRVLEPYREDVVVSVESTFNWYWLGDVCMAAKIPFILGHAQYMKAIHQGKTKNDRVDSAKIAKLTAAKMFPQSYVYPKEMRKIRDLLRRRMYFVRERAALKGHVNIVGAQYNVDLSAEAGSKVLRGKALIECFNDLDIQESVDCDYKTAGFLDSIVRRIEKYVLKRVKQDNEAGFNLLCTIPGIGHVLGLTILYEMHNLERFPRCQNFMSYARLVSCVPTSNDKKVGKPHRKIGNPYLKWAFSEAAMHMSRVNPEVHAYVEQLKKRYGAAGAWSRLSQKIGRTVYYMLKSNTPFSIERFMKNSKEALESKVTSLEPCKEAAMVID